MDADRMSPDNVRRVLRDRGMCGHIAKRPLCNDPAAGDHGLLENAACIQPLGHDMGMHESSKEDLATELARAREEIADLRRTAEILDGHLDDARTKLGALNADRSAIYSERNRLVAALAWVIIGRRDDKVRQGVLNTIGWDASLGMHPESDVAWDPEWRTIVYLMTPHGQLSWHVHDSDVPLFQMLSVRHDRAWDGHGTPEKYRRLELLR